jgi:5-methylcytosine-specific restriction endonuclease McrA
LTRIKASAAEWTVIRQQKLGLCRGCGEPGTDLHHLVPRSLMGADVAANVVPLCHLCHMRYEDRANGWRDVAAGIRKSLTPGERKYVCGEKGAPFLDRYYPPA